MFYSKEYVEDLRKRYPKGTRIVVHEMCDTRPVESGSYGTVKAVDDAGTIHCVFDNGRCIGVIYGVDSFSKVIDMSKVMENFQKKWQNVEFESSCYTTPQFSKFSKSLKLAINKACNEFGFELVNWSRGHFYCSFFLKRYDGVLFYVNVGDVRFCIGKDSCLQNVLYRSALHAEDYGGAHSKNCYCEIKDLFKRLEVAKEVYLGK